MASRLEMFTKEDLGAIHQATLDILDSCGMEFPSEKTRQFFRDHGFRVEGNKVYITEDQVKKALSTAPSAFSARARNPKHNIKIGGDDFVIGIIGGAVNTIDDKGNMIPSTLAVYADFCKLVHTSDLPLLAPHGCCYPSDVPAETCYLDMLYLDMTMTDRVIKANNGSDEKALRSLELIGIIFDGLEGIKKTPASLSVVNIKSPLCYAYDQSEALMVLSGYNQPLAVTNMMMLGATGPISIPGAIVISNAEVLAGVVLSQLACPGVGIVYGSTNCPMDMKSMLATVGSPETMILSRAAQALADYYKLPCRTGGSMTDSHLPDAQAMIDSTLIMQNCLEGGAHYIHQGLGMLSSYLTASLEKLVLDEEMVRIVLASFKLPAINKDTMGLDLIKKLGSNGNYINEASTLKGFRNIFRSKFLNRLNHGPWLSNGARSAFDAAREEVAKRLANYRKPDMEPKLETEIARYVATHKQAVMTSPRK